MFISPSEILNLYKKMRSKDPDLCRLNSGFDWCNHHVVYLLCLSSQWHRGQLFVQALTTFLASVSAGAAEEVCAALQVPALEVRTRGRFFQSMDGLKNIELI